MRPPQESDASPMLEIHQDPHAIVRVTLTAPPTDLQGAWRNIAMMVGHWYLRGYGQWTVLEKRTGEVIGRVGLWNPAGSPGVELGWIIRHACWGRGYATEAARAALSWTWLHTEIDHVISVIEPDNVRAIRVAEKIGQRFEGATVSSNKLVHVYGIHRMADDSI